MDKWRVVRVKPGMWNATNPEGISANRRTWRYAMRFMVETERRINERLKNLSGGNQ